MKILITNIYSYKNKGDAAIVLSAISGLKQKYPDSEFILSSDDLNDFGKYGSYKVFPSFNRLYHNKINNDFFNNILNLIFCILLILIFKIEKILYILQIKWNPLLIGSLKTKIKTYRDADMIFAVGGGYILSKTKTRKIDQLIGRASLHITCLEFYFAKAYNKPVILLHQSIGPFYDEKDVRLVVKYLKNVDLIIARESYTYKLLKKNGLEKSVLKPDLGFSFNFPGVSYLRNSDLKSFDYKVGITARSCLNEKDQFHYEKELASFINCFLRKNQNAMFYFMPQVIYSERNDNDLVVSKMIFNSIEKIYKDRCICLDNDFSPQDLKATIGDCNLFIGTRMHSNIFALSNFVKTIAIAYEYKTSGIMEMLQLQDYAITAEEVTSGYLFKVFNMLENDGEYREKLKSKINQIIEETWNFELPAEL